MRTVDAQALSQSNAPSLVPAAELQITSRQAVAGTYPRARRVLPWSSTAPWISWGETPHG